MAMAAVFFAVNKANSSNAKIQIDSALNVTAGIFKKTLADRNQRLLEKARLLSADFAFKEASATGEHSTILSALNNQQLRIGADLMMLASINGNVIANTLDSEHKDLPFSLPALLERAMSNEFGEASAVEYINAVPYQLVVVPLFTPEPSAWIIIGFTIDDAFTLKLQQLTKSHVTLLARSAGHEWLTVASTLDDSYRKALVGSISRTVWKGEMSFTLHMLGSEYVSFISHLEKQKDHEIIAVLQRSLDEALLPYMRLKYVLIAVFVLAFILSMIGGGLIARSVTQPVKVLAKGAHKIEHGDYSHTVELKQNDELGELATSFNYMVKGLAERDKVRDLFGKVVSPAIAEELLKRDVKLGGEEREVTVFFSDVRNFTTLCESRSPQTILSLLNSYLTRASNVIDANGGVVDKYIGDAIMAIFGAPLCHADDATNAIHAALDSCEILHKINAEFEQQGLPRIGVGIGINTAVVVAGNMGSNTRLNYTVIGDGVNLASRLEGLTKKYGVEIIVSESTMSAAKNIAYRELDKVCVKGKTEAVTIYQPISRLRDMSEIEKQELEKYHAALHNYRGMNWNMAYKQFNLLFSEYPDKKLYQMYLSRLETFISTPPAKTWDGVFMFNEK